MPDSKIDQLKQDIALFSEEEDDRIALLCYANSRTGEMRGFTYGDLRALCDVADTIRNNLTGALCMACTDWVDNCRCPLSDVRIALARLDEDHE